MARGRHRRRSGLLSRLLPRRRRLSRLEALRAETARLRGLADAAAATASAALVRAAAADDRARAADLRAFAAQAALGSAHDEILGLRADLAALREELVWAFAAGRAEARAAEPPAVIDLREGSATTA
ncbi:MAG: hypothetical protein EPN99_03875 [Frankiales bacterium]|nr:MAG: hypothetical protein EPN99_03875 [Frankiales bacterium]